MRSRERAAVALRPGGKALLLGGACDCRPSFRPLHQGKVWQDPAGKENDYAKATERSVSLGSRSSFLVPQRPR